jgi:hypothetical protein
MTRSMTRWTVAGCMALAAISAAAVLDVGAATVAAAQDASPFAGSWSGTWEIAERGLTGAYDWTISDTGRIEGTVGHDQSGEGGSVVGRVHADGAVNLTAFAPGDDPSSGSGFHFDGTAVIDDDGKLVVSVIGLGEAQSGRPALVAILELN